MATIVPFKALRPVRDKAYLVSSMPAYIYPKHILEAKLESNPYTFLHVINPEFRTDNKTQPNSIEGNLSIASFFFTSLMNLQMLVFLHKMK